MSKVYFTKEITENSLIRIYEAVGKNLEGKVAVKISTGEPGGHNFLNPNLIKGLVQKLNGTIVECNTAYQGRRNTTDEYLKVVDKACIDLIYDSKDSGRDHFVERVERQNGTHIIDYAENIGIGTTNYELITLD